MALAKVRGVVVNGVLGEMVRVEVDVSDGLPSVGIVGLPDASVSEARWRARCAVDSTGLPWPNRRITISLSPAEVRKHGAGLDLPMAVGVLAASKAVPSDSLGQTAFVGELGLDGRLRQVHGTLAAVLAARSAGMRSVVVSRDVLHDVGAVPGIEIRGAESLTEVCRLLAGSSSAVSIARAPDLGAAAEVTLAVPDLADVRGQQIARWGLEVAAAGGHHVALLGSPGVGKTLLASRLPGLLPPLAQDDALEVAAIHSVAGSARPPSQLLIPPSQAPHHSASSAAILGSVRGGRAIPGAVTLSHRGVLFLDEAPEFSRPALEGLRQPIESGVVALHRAGWNGSLPAAFQLVLAANPCPCGMRMAGATACSCSPASVRRYAARLSGPLMDRIDIRLALARPADAELASSTAPECSAVVRERVAVARERARSRLSGTPWRTNAEVAAGALRRTWRLRDDAAALLAEYERRAVTLRGADRIVRMAWTLADLAGVSRPGRDEIAGALALRGAQTPWV